MSDRSVSHENLDSILFSTDEQLDQLMSNTTIFADLGFDLLNPEDDPALLQNGEKRDQLKVGDRFNNFRDFKDAVADLAIAEHWEYNVVKSERSRVRLRCYFDKVCQWHARASYRPKSEDVVIAIWNGEHTCQDETRKDRPLVARMSYLLELVPKLLTIDRKTPTRVIQDQILRATEVLVREPQCRILRNKLTEDTLSQQSEDFLKIPEYLKRLHTANRHHENGEDYNGSDDLVTDLLLTEGHVFRRIFVGPHISEQQWIHSIPFVALDGTYLQNCYRQTLLLAVGRNGNNESWIIAWAIVESENDESWDWFVERLCKCVPSLTNRSEWPRFQTPCSISDRNASALKAQEKWLRGVTLIYCCWHLMRNVLEVTKHANKTAIKEAWWKFPYAKNENDWKRAVEKMKQVGGQEAVDYIEKLDKTKFCAWKLTSARYGHNSSGIVESQNSHIRELREMGIVELLDALWTRSSRKRQITYEKAIKWMDQRDRYTPFARKKIMANTAHSRRSAQRAMITAHRPGEKVLEAKVICRYDGIGERIHIVKCQEYHCTCGHFQEWLLPCSHAITAIRFAGRAVYEWVAPFWEPAYVALGTAYREQETGDGYINNHMRTIKIDDIPLPDFCDDECYPPPPKPKKAGPNQKKRKEKGDKPERPQNQSYSCTRCGRTGHNKRNKKDCPAWRPY